VGSLTASPHEGADFSWRPRLLKTLGNPAANGIKVFSRASELLELGQKESCLPGQGDDAVNQHWRQNRMPAKNTGVVAGLTGT